MSEEPSVSSLDGGINVHTCSCCVLLQEGDVLQEEVEKRDDGLTYYSWCVTVAVPCLHLLQPSQLRTCTD